MTKLFEVTLLKTGFIQVNGQAQGQDSRINAKVFICVFMDWDAIKVHEKEWGQYPAILVEQVSQ